ncbi:MAG: hypothetical protein ACRDOH_10165 [Streptosporangiaceae bacterium]
MQCGSCCLVVPAGGYQREGQVQAGGGGAAWSGRAVGGGVQAGEDLPRVGFGGRVAEP